jgi:hypothetical protein
VVFLAHFTGGGIESALDIPYSDFFDYLDEAMKLYEAEMKAPRRAVVAGFEKR